MSIEQLPTPTRTPHQDVPSYDASMLMRGKDQALIILEDKIYTLRRTRAGKLILTK